MSKKFIHVLLAEDNEDEIFLILEAINSTNAIDEIKLNYVRDGDEVMKYLRKEGVYKSRIFPDLLLLDINMPKKNGHEVLDEIKKDAVLKSLPVVMLSTSTNQDDIELSYRNHASCYISKPSDFHDFQRLITTIKDYWLRVVSLPKSA